MACALGQGRAATGSTDHADRRSGAVGPGSGVGVLVAPGFRGFAMHPRPTRSAHSRQSPRAIAIPVPARCRAAPAAVPVETAVLVALAAAGPVVALAAVGPAVP